jgi:uncharacterized protein (DUF305 family)
MRAISLTLAFVSVAAFADTASAQTPGQTNSPATQAYMQAMHGMDDKMKGMKPTGDPSMDFVMMMAPHHQAAVEMAEAYLKYGKDPQLTKMAKAIISSQKKEIREMEAWQKKHGMHGM